MPPATTKKGTKGPVGVIPTPPKEEGDGGGKKGKGKKGAPKKEDEKVVEEEKGKEPVEPVAVRVPLELEVARDAYNVQVKPELVVEIAFDGVQRSSRYPGGLALRFARVLRYRTDKSGRDADTFAAVQAVAGAPEG